MRSSVVVVVVLFVATTLVSTCCHAHFTEFDYNPIQLLRRYRSEGSTVVLKDELDCLSLRLAVETNNHRNKLLPTECVNYVGEYMLGESPWPKPEDDDYIKGTQYDKDCNAMADDAIEYANNIKSPCEKDVWVFDIDETTLSNLPYYASDDIQFGSKPYNREKFQEWVKQGKSPAVPAVLRLYKTVMELGFKTVILTGVSDILQEVRSKNLNDAGYDKWEELIFKKEKERGIPSVFYKSMKRRELVNQGYRIVGNVGDQWSDLQGTNVGERTFKIPNPMYYVG